MTSARPTCASWCATRWNPYRYQIEQHGFTLEEEIGDVPPLRVDREAMARSLVNLVNNALKYSQDRKYIGVNLYRENGSVKLEVIDHGIGIPPHEQSKIFEKFIALVIRWSTTPKGAGSGFHWCSILRRHTVVMSWWTARPAQAANSQLAFR